MDACCILIAQNHRTKGEFYLAPTYNELIERYGAKIKAVAVEDFHGLGTPEDVQAFGGMLTAVQEGEIQSPVKSFRQAAAELLEQHKDGEIRAPWAKGGA